MTELPKTYDPAAIEAATYKAWLDEKCFAVDPNHPGEPYAIVIPPPNVTGALHLGHAINNTLQDILTRKARMEGKAALWIPGLDHAGIATQAVVEKQLKEKEGLDRHAVGREGLVERIWKWKEQYGDRIINQLQRLGCSCDWDRQRFTLDDMCAKAVRETFFKLFKDGLVYRGKRLVNWDVHLQTSISDDEIYHETIKTHLWHIRYEIVDAKDEGGRMKDEKGDSSDPPSSFILHPSSFVTIATTRPETLLGDTAVAVHSQDPRWNWAIGKSARLPLLGRLIPIIADDILVDPKFGSGVVKVTPAHDPNDYAAWQRHQGKPDQIDIINILNPDGTLNDAAGPYKGLTVNKARHAVVNDLTAADLLVKEEPYETQIGHSDRSKTPIQPYLSDQWFVKMAPLAEPALQVVRDGTIKFFPERHAQQYLSWLGEKRDWPISRQLWWGHRIPVWRGDFGKLIPGVVNAAQDDVVRSYRLPITFGDVEISIAFRRENGESITYICVPPSCEKFEATLAEHGFIQDPDVLDTWFSSALWPHSTLGWPAKTPDLAKWYPTRVLLTGRDIITLWVARMVMMGIYNCGLRIADCGLEDKSAASQSEIRNPKSAIALGIPFHHVAINPTILDGKGERMSKSKGNGVDPVDVIDTHGADALRFTLATMATETQDVRMPVKPDAHGRNTSEKFDFGRNFANKLWNAARFVLATLDKAKDEGGRMKDEKGNSSAPFSSFILHPSSLADRWIVSRLNRAVTEANAAMAVYRFDLYAKACYDFFWRDFCDWYLESTKVLLKDPATRSQTMETLAVVLDGSLRLMHPVIPFITETIWEKLNEAAPRRPLCGRIEKRLILSAWPVVAAIDDDAEHVFPRLQGIIGVIRNLRNEHKVDQKKRVTVSIAPPGEEAVRMTHDNRDLIEALATCTIQAIAADLAPPPGAVRATANGNCDLYVKGLSDPSAQAQLVEKKRADLAKLIGSLKGRLANQSYVAKAPPKLVEESQRQLADAEAELAKL